MKGIVGSVTYLYLLALFIFLPQAAYAVDCSQYQMPIITSTTESGTPIKQGEKIQVGLKNTSNDELTYNILMSPEDVPSDWVNKLPDQKLQAGGTVVQEVSTTPTTKLGGHYLRITVYHYNPDCYVGYQDLTFEVVSASGGTGGGGTGGGGTGGGTTTPERFTFNIPKWGSVGDLETEGGGNWIVGLLTRIANWILDLAGALAVLAIVYSGLMYITSAGNQEKSEKAKKNLVWAIVGLIIILLSYLVVEWVRNILSTGST